MIDGVGQAGAGAAGAHQARGGGSETAELSQNKGDKQAGSVQQQATVSVLSESLDQKEQMAMQLINTAPGVGQNVDVFA